ncbi:uncharacterized protein N7483_013038 [Penicillium malachiteum]|uniref:uncharacterized protein n=1 Tax=Penicillium malachiteum TaxID=1324776 RepID=UPI002548F312|nr:uncharacterized protein N7483_013038 [Penicillium malachiteum]KAJ5715857.1 hypothetical protein N7483_013038 [Penicillium malachiteum]
MGNGQACRQAQRFRPLHVIKRFPCLFTSNADIRLASAQSYPTISGNFVASPKPFLGAKTMTICPPLTGYLSLNPSRLNEAKSDIAALPKA